MIFYQKNGSIKTRIKTITFIPHEKMQMILDRWDDSKKQNPPHDLFLAHQDGAWIATDNSTGDCWNEQFETLDEACRYLYGDDSTWQNE